MAGAFLVGANIAWLNPDPDAAAYRPFEAPVLWQYDADAGLEIVSAAYFPDAFRQYPERISRPGYPAVVHGLGTAIAAVAAPIRELSPLEAAGAGYLTLKAIVVLTAVFAAFDLLRRHIDERAALLAAMLLALHPLVLEYSTPSTPRSCSSSARSSSCAVRRGPSNGTTAVSRSAALDAGASSTRGSSGALRGC